MLGLETNGRIFPKLRTSTFARTFLCPPTFLDQDQCIVGSSEIEAADLNHAIDKAQSILRARPHYQGVELWDGRKHAYPVVRAEGHA